MADHTVDHTEGRTASPTTLSVEVDVATAGPTRRSSGSTARPVSTGVAMATVDAVTIGATEVSRASRASAASVAA